MAEAITLQQRIAELAEDHGSLRSAASALGCDVGYLSRLASGQKTEPSDMTLHALGLRRVVSYERAEPSPTAGMTLAQRILHVGGRNNAAGYVEFGSTQAVAALIRQVLRDREFLPPEQPQQKGGA
ncbi:hypothetical protein [Pseudorhodoferax sp. Leaf274]|uniref:hypothetical protein n=1 Tax=Pseudorhodoferax sp. Leaf274 TaxID=1736318 RepID=UPI000703AD63|nr:hypothetical protein [Pseudorhodoferax sp. Leaf274]KQP43887.1 hypothetical protein ASF44_28575 [Pseudorhodoferax sp. Leaf274]